MFAENAPLPAPAAGYSSLTREQPSGSLHRRIIKWNGIVGKGYDCAFGCSPAKSRVECERHPGAVDLQTIGWRFVSLRTRAVISLITKLHLSQKRL